MARWLKLALVVITAVVVTRLVLRPDAPVQAPGQAAPALVLPDLSGRTLDLTTLRGKVVAVNFWASWCGPCQAEIPELAEVWRAHRGRCFELLGVAEESGRADVDAMARRIPYPILFDADARALRPWGVPAYPRTFVVDVEGKVRHVFAGAVGRRELTEAILPLLPESCPAT